MDKIEELLESQHEEESTLYQSLVKENYFETTYLNLGYKSAKKNIEKIFKLNNGKFVFIFNYRVRKGYEIISRQLISILNEDLRPLVDIKINDKMQYICEIKEEEYYLIFCQINNLYILPKDYDNPKIIIGMNIYFILQIKINKYIISNENGINSYEGPILNITKGKLKIIKIQKEKKDKEKGKEKEKEKEKVKEIYNFGIKINQDTIALLNNKNELMIVDINSKKEIYNIPNNEFSNRENCYALFKSKENADILLLGCKHSKKNGIHIIIVNNGIYWDFLETNDFEIHCFFPIYDEKIIEAFSESYDDNYIYFLLGGNQPTKNKNKLDKNQSTKIIKLYKINLNDKTLKDVKNIWENNSYYLDNNLKSIIQYKYKYLIINFEKGETIKFYINNFNLKNEKEIVKIKENEDFYEEINEFADKMNEQDTIELVKICYKKRKKAKKDSNKYYGQKPVKYIYQLKYNNKYYLFIVLKNNILVYNNSESIGEFYISHEIRCLCQKSESEVFICSSNGLYKITIIIDENKARLDKINDMKYNFIEKIKDNDYIVSNELNQKTYRELKDIISINKEEFIIRIKDEYYIFYIEKNKETYKELKDIQSINEAKFIIRIKDNDYIFSIKKNGMTYRELKDIQYINEREFIIRIKDEYYIFSIEENKETYAELRDKHPINEAKFIIRTKDNNYIFSIKNGKTFRVMRDIASLNEEDFYNLNNENKIKKISDNAYKIGVHIKINNKIIVFLMDNIDINVSNIINKIKEGKLEIIDINNVNDNYVSQKNKGPYNLFKNSIILFKAKESPNYIFLTATVKMNENQKNGIFALNLNIKKSLNKSIFEYFHDIENYKINSMILYERQNNSNEKYFTYILTEGNNDNNEFEIRLYKIIYSNDIGEACFSFEYIQKIIDYKDIKKYKIFLAQSINYGELIISFSIGFYLYKINNELIKEKEEEKVEEEEKEEEPIIIRYNS